MSGIPPHPPIDADKYACDEKSRVAIPMPFRSHYVPGGIGAFVLTVAPDGCLALYPVDVWSSIQEGMTPEKMGIDQFLFARFARLVASSTTRVITDPQGRIRIPAALKTFANIDREVYVLSMNDHLELWNFDDYQKTQGSPTDLMPLLHTLHFMRGTRPASTPAISGSSDSRNEQM